MAHSFFIFLGALFGLAGGSGLNVWLWRSEHLELKGQHRSGCIKCGRTLVWFELIPIFSFVALEGRCRTCKNPIPWWYPLSELLGGILGAGTIAFSLAKNFDGLTIALYVVLVSLLLALALHDALYRTLPLLLIGIGTVAGIILVFWLNQPLWGALLSGGAVAGFFLLQYLISRGRWIGSGDIPLGFMVGILLGWPHTLIGLWFTYVLGALIGLFLILCGRAKYAQQLPLGSFLALGTLIVLFAGNPISSWFSHLLR
jgi:prepilin signal peptidase PulO-like enzyme (type II secretory pathway)